ncbi:uncharacterized protein RDI95_006542 [Morus bassanus]
MADSAPVRALNEEELLPVITGFFDRTHELFSRYLSIKLQKIDQTWQASLYLLPIDKRTCGDFILHDPWPRYSWTTFWIQNVLSPRNVMPTYSMYWGTYTVAIGLLQQQSHKMMHGRFMRTYGV